MDSSIYVKKSALDMAPDGCAMINGCRLVFDDNETGLFLFLSRFPHSTLNVLFTVRCFTRARLLVFSSVFADCSDCSWKCFPLKRSNVQTVEKGQPVENCQRFTSVMNLWPSVITLDILVKDWRNSWTLLQALVRVYFLKLAPLTLFKMRVFVFKRGLFKTNRMN